MGLARAVHAIQVVALMIPSLCRYLQQVSLLCRFYCYGLLLYHGELIATMGTG